MKNGITIMAVIDIAFYLTIGIVVTVAFETLLNPILWFMVVLIADAALLISTQLDRPGPMLVWQIVMMLHIVLQFIMWIGRLNFCSLTKTI